MSDVAVGEIGATLPQVPIPTKLRAALDALRTPWSLDTIAGELLERQLSVTCAVAGVVLLLTPDGTELELVASVGYEGAALEGWERSPLELQLPVHDAVREDRVVVVCSVADFGSRYAHTRLFDDHPHALAAFPLRSASGQVLGAVGLRFDVGPDEAAALDDDVVAGELLALVAGESLRHQRVVEPLRERVEHLQHALDSRVVIEQAKGVLAERHGISPDAAFERMRTLARNRGARLHRVAAEVLDGTVLL